MGQLLDAMQKEREEAAAEEMRERQARGAEGTRRRLAAERSRLERMRDELKASIVLVDAVIKLSKGVDPETAAAADRFRQRLADERGDKAPRSRRESLTIRLAAIEQQLKELV